MMDSRKIRLKFGVLHINAPGPEEVAELVGPRKITGRPELFA